MYQCIVYYFNLEALNSHLIADIFPPFLWLMIFIRLYIHTHTKGKTVTIVLVCKCAQVPGLRLSTRDEKNDSFFGTDLYSLGAHNSISTFQLCIANISTLAICLLLSKILKYNWKEYNKNNFFYYSLRCAFLQFL